MVICNRINLNYMKTITSNNRHKITEEQKDLKILESREKDIDLSEVEFDNLLRKKNLL